MFNATQLASQECQVLLTESNFCACLTRNKVQKVVLSVPHDGAWRYEFDGVFTPRQGTTVRDLHVWPIAREIFNQTDSTSVIRWMLPRTLVDYNRAEDGRDYVYYSGNEKIEPAYQDTAFSLPYWTYHKSVWDALSSAVNEYGPGMALLLDLHGFTKQPAYSPEGWYDCILWTGNRKSIKYGNPDEKLAGFLQDEGFKVFLPEEKPVREEVDDDFDAWHITRHYSDRLGINAIQIEVASHLRGPENRSGSEKLAACIAEFVNQNFG